MPGKGGGTPRKASSVSLYCACHNSLWPRPFRVKDSQKIEPREKKDIHRIAYHQGTQTAGMRGRAGSEEASGSRGPGPRRRRKR